MIFVQLLAWLVRLAIRLFPWLSADYRRRIRARQKCPACGAVKKHRMAYDETQRKVILSCVDCSAFWGFDPVIRPAKWAKAGKEDER